MSKQYAHLYTMAKTSVKKLKKKRHPLWELWAKGWKKKNQIMSKQYAHLHTMAKTSVKFQNDWPKTVGGVALTRHPLTIRTHGTPTDYYGFR